VSVDWFRPLAWAGMRGGLGWGQNYRGGWADLIPIELRIHPITRWVGDVAINLCAMLAFFQVPDSGSDASNSRVLIPVHDKEYFVRTVRKVHELTAVRKVWALDG